MQLNLKYQHFISILSSPKSFFDRRASTFKSTTAWVGKTAGRAKPAVPFCPPRRSWTSTRAARRTLLEIQGARHRPPGCLFLRVLLPSEVSGGSEALSQRYGTFLKRTFQSKFPIFQIIIEIAKKYFFRKSWKKVGENFFVGLGRFFGGPFYAFFLSDAP